MTIVNDDSMVFNKLEASLTDDARIVIYDRHMFIVQATSVGAIRNLYVNGHYAEYHFADCRSALVPML